MVCVYILFYSKPSVKPSSMKISLPRILMCVWLNCLLVRPPKANPLCVVVLLPMRIWKKVKSFTLNLLLFLVFTHHSRFVSGYVTRIMVCRRLTYDYNRDPTATTVSRRSLTKTRLLARTVTRLCTAARNARIQPLNHITDICAPRMKRH